MQPCPRQVEGTLPSQREHVSQWREDGTCSYCGSMSPADFFKAIEAGYQLGPTDKDYKVYVRRPDPGAGEPWIYSCANFQPDSSYVQVTEENLPSMPGAKLQLLIGSWVKITPKHAFTDDKFYFYHLSEEEMNRFIELFNSHKINIGYPGRFYRFPYFMRQVPKS